MTNGGHIEGVWVFTRHGDRTPSRPLCAAGFSDAESDFWTSKLPHPDAGAPFRALSELYPPDIHPSNEGQFKDVSRWPYGFLTRLGMQQQVTNGKRFFARYDHYGHHCDGTGTNATREKWGNGFLNSWEVKAYSTNYLRTITSVQCFLDGLLGTKSYNPYQHTSETDQHWNTERPSPSRTDTALDDTNKDKRPFVPPDHSELPFVGDDLSFGTVPIVVRDKRCDLLNAFDRDHDRMMQLVGEVIEAPEFKDHDATASPLAARLANFLPGLLRRGRKTFGGPSGINWIDASDHFVCRSAHGLKYSRFSIFEHDDRVEATMSAMAHQTIAHLAWRFRKWYQNPALLAELAGPPLREVLSQMTTTPDLRIDQRHPFVIYSCHDVTILGLLYAIGADFLGDETKSDWRFWPPYASTLVFELVRRVEPIAEGGSTHVVRILLNGQPVICANLQDYYSGTTETVEHVGTGPRDMLQLSDLEQIVSRLENMRLNGNNDSNSEISDDDDDDEEEEGNDGER